MGRRHMIISTEFYSDNGPHMSINQDNYYVDGIINDKSSLVSCGSRRFSSKKASFAAVYDGIGGGSSGEIASIEAAKCAGLVTDNLTHDFSKAELKDSLSCYYNVFYMNLTDRIKPDRQKSSVCGTTCAGAVVKDTCLYPVWCGDSRVYLLRKGKLKLLTKDHSLAQEKIDYGLITEKEARNMKAWHTLTAFMGSEDMNMATGDTLELVSGDRIFICTDGITDVCTDDRLEHILSGSARKVKETLNHEVISKSEDNCTYIIMDVKENGLCRIVNMLRKQLEACLLKKQKKSMER